MSKNIETTEALLSTIPIDGPRLIVIKDTQKLYYDTSDGNRILLNTSSGGGTVTEDEVETILEKLSTYTDEEINNFINTIWEGDPDAAIDEENLSEDVINSVWEGDPDADTNDEDVINSIIKSVWGD